METENNTLIFETRLLSMFSTSELDINVVRNSHSIKVSVVNSPAYVDPCTIVINTKGEVSSKIWIDAYKVYSACRDVFNDGILETYYRIGSYTGNTPSYDIIQLDFTPPGSKGMKVSVTKDDLSDAFIPKLAYQCLYRLPGDRYISLRYNDKQSIYVNERGHGNGYKKIYSICDGIHLYSLVFEGYSLPGSPIRKVINEERLGLYTDTYMPAWRLFDQWLEINKDRIK